VKVDERGRVTQATVARSSGHPALDERALTTVRERWVFKPARQGNRPVPAEVMIPVRFTLENR
jgi:protein TonB